MIIKVMVDGYGLFKIDSSKINDLLIWLNQNRATIQSTEPFTAPTVEIVEDDKYDGKMLINE